MGSVDRGVALLGGLPPDAFRRGTIVLVEFEPHSLWYETSVTLAAHALAAGIRTDYHTFQHVPEDVVAALLRQHIDVAEAERSKLFRLIDSYSIQTGLAKPAHHAPYEFASQSLRIADWKERSSNVLDDPSERGLLHIDENDSLLTRYNRERDVIDFFQTRAFEAARKRDFLFVHGLMTGVHTKPFYRKFESLADVVLDFRGRESDEGVEQVMRVRAIRGMACDTRWRLLTVTSRGEARLLGAARSPAAKAGRSERTPRGPGVRRRTPSPIPDLRNRNAGRVLEVLVTAFADDVRRRRLTETDAGWRSLVQIARASGLAPSSLYPRHGAVNPVMGELVSQGLIETRVVPGARGRGGITLRVRAAQDQESVRAILHGQP